VVDVRDHCVLLNSGKHDGIRTHTMAWAALAFWADEMPIVSQLLEIITPAGRTLNDWFRNFGVPASAIDPIGAKWLKLWGLDLQRLANDQSARNEASYRPTRMGSEPPSDARETSSFLADLWMLSEPLGYSRFESLDRHLLRLSLDDLAKGTQIRPAQFSSRVSHMLDAMNLGVSVETEWKPFLTQRSGSGINTVLVRAGKHGPRVRQEHLGVISRAFLLLRVATGCCSRLLGETVSGREAVEFWWKLMGEDLGFWERNEQIINLTDLWADVEVALDELQNWDDQVESSDSSPSYASWQRSCVQALWVLSGCERIALWGLGL